MSFFGEDNPAPAVPCARCSAPSVWEVWGHAVCGECAAAWSALPQTTAGAVEQSLGVTWSKEGPAHRGQVITGEAYERLLNGAFERFAAKWVNTKREAA